MPIPVPPPGRIDFTAVNAIVGAVSTKPVTFDAAFVAATQSVVATAYPVFDTAVWKHTSPTIPYSWNSADVPGRNGAVFTQLYSVADGNCCTACAVNPAGVVTVVPVITGDTVSTTIRFVIVADPVFDTSNWYVNAPPDTGAGCTCVFTTVTPTVDGWITFPTTFVKARTSAQFTTSRAVTYAVFDVAVGAHTTP